MSRRLLIGVAPLAAVLAFAASPALAATQGCKPPKPCTSAVCVYVEQTPPPAAGSCGKKPTHHPGGGQTTTPPVQPVVPISPKVAKKLHKTSKKNQKLVRKVATNPALGNAKPLKVSRAATHIKAPSAIGAAFDLGSGPTALFAALLAAAVLLALVGGLGHRKR